MTDAILRLLAKAGKNIQNPFGSESRYVRPRQGDTARDASKIAADMRSIGGDLTRTAKRELAKHGK